MQIEELLASRTDLSTFLVHLTKKNNDRTAKDCLINIIQSRQLIAENPFGIATRKLREKGTSSDSQKAVCFTETPLEHLSLLASEIEGRTYRFEPYGIAITRKQGRRQGVNPIWYLDITPGHDWLTNPFNTLIADALASNTFELSPISRITPFIEQMGTHTGDPDTPGHGYRKEFWWEREWRHVGDFELPTTYIVLCPRGDILEIKEIIEGMTEAERPSVSFLDPAWSLEYIIGKLAGFRNSDLGPF